MESISICLSSSSPPFLNHPKPHKPTFKYTLIPPNSLSTSNSIPHQTHFPLTNTIQTPKSYKITTPKSPNLSLNPHLSFLSLPFSFPLSSLASENAGQVSNKINLEAILVSIDEFFTRYPFFVAGVTFIWLIAIPLTQEYFQKYKFISAINAFKKLRDDPNAQLLDIRDDKSLGFLNSPNLKLLEKSVVQVEFSEENEDGLVGTVLEKFNEPDNTIICILDNFDGNSMKVAELLFKNGFKEAYAIRGGVRGKNGWLAIQETLLPPSVHIFPKKKVKKSQQFELNGGANQQTENGGQISSVGNREQVENGLVNKFIEPTPRTEDSSRSLSPYSMYPDMKPPSSPTPSKPRN